MHQRKRLRLSHYDYSLPGGYFVTACTHDRTCLFGAIENGIVDLFPAGKIVEATWCNLPAYYPHVKLDEFVVMPNHIHGLLFIGNEGGQRLSEIMRAFKAFATREINAARLGGSAAVWQRGYYEHIVRGENDLSAIREYIRNNPIKWDLDKENPARQRR